MELVIRINMDGAAFENCQGDESSRILHSLADEMEGWHCLSLYAIRESQIRDINGNICGFVKVEE